MAPNQLLRTLDEKVDPKEAALIVVDVQNDFCSEDGFFGRLGYDLSHIRAAADATESLVEEARTHGVPVVFIRSTYDEQYLNDPFRERSVRRSFGDRCITGTWGADFYNVKPLPNEPVVTKHRYSAFQYTDLEAILQGLGVKTLIMSGVTTNVCVESTARDGYFRGFYIVFLRDCTGTTNEAREGLLSEDLHEWTLVNIGLTFGVVTSASEVVDCWRRGVEE